MFDGLSHLIGGLLLLSGVSFLVAWAVRREPRYLLGAGILIFGGFTYQSVLPDLYEALSDTVLDELGEAPASSASPTDSSTPEAGFDLPDGFLWWGLGLLAVVSVVAPTAVYLHRRQRRKAAHVARWRVIEAEHDAVVTAYGDYLADVLEWLDRPALNDVTVPQTEALLHALDGADDARRSGDLAAYREAVSALKTAWRTADEHARMTGTRHLPHEQRATVAKARGLLKLALDEGGDVGDRREHERRAAYTKARALLDGVFLTIPQQAVAQLETRRRLALSAAEPAVAKEPRL
ncbi:hypothetical protein PBV88_23490 [Streptomyces sp. T21Q-yed]|nr:hypothetical protein [Streptomyces sp. T21Q-yed]